MSTADPKPKAIKLSPTSYLMLGMVRLGVSSGYAIKKAADSSTQNFWPISLALVYPELARLEGGNTSSLEPVGGGVHEIRIHFGPGYRVYLGWDGAALVILLGGSMLWTYYTHQPPERPAQAATPAPAPRPPPNPDAIAAERLTKALQENVETELAAWTRRAPGS